VLLQMEQQQQATFDSDASFCSSIVKEGHQCKNKPVILVENDEFFFCWIHWSIWYKEKYGCTTTPEPWELLGFKESPDDTKLENKTILDIRSLLRKGPGDSKKGFIYIFKSHLKDDLDMFKIGYTCEESVEKRTNKWDGSILLKSWKVSHAVFCRKFNTSLFYSIGDVIVLFYMLLNNLRHIKKDILVFGMIHQQLQFLIILQNKIEKTGFLIIFTNHL
jgi:hypothetical protein